MLDAESVVFDESGFIPLRRSGWLSASSEAVRPGRRGKRAPRLESGAQRKRGSR
jgi:hypothetical protein